MIGTSLDRVVVCVGCGRDFEGQIHAAADEVIE
jgi:hypothetical protein